MARAMRQERITVGEITLNVRLQGDPSAPMVLMLHGFPEYSGMWARLMDDMSDRYFCVAPDQRGYATSSKPEGVDNYAAPKIAADAAGLIEQLSPDRPVHVIGHDWGASIAYSLAMIRSELLSTLTIVNGVHPGAFQHALLTDPDQADASQYIPKLKSPKAEERLAENDLERLWRAFSAFSNLSWMTPEQREGYQRAWSQPGALTGMLNWYRASPIHVPKPGEDTSGRENPFDDPRKYRITMPHLLVWGMQDAALRPSSFQRLDNFCDDLRIVEIADSDHWVVNARPEAVHQAISAFLGEHT